MVNSIKTGPVHHTTLTVVDVARASGFYTEVLGFQEVGKFGPRVVLGNGSVFLVLGPAPDPSCDLSSDRFDENRVGLDHLSFTVNSREELEEATRVLDQRGIPHGEVVDLADFRIYVLMLRDPDNIQVELTAPYS
jgi:glyoxylase I family protein